MQNSRAQILLPAVMLAPIFILVIYLLFETSKLSMTKVRQQFALDNSAYSQMSTTSAYLNAVAMVNGPLPYRVMKTQSQVLVKKSSSEKKGDNVTVFDAFYRAGSFLAMGGAPSGDVLDGGKSAIDNKLPTAESTNYKLQYNTGKRANWNKEDPQDLPDGDNSNKSNAESIEGKVILTDREIADNYFFGATGIGLSSVKEYLTIYVRTGSIYASQKYVYNTTIRKGEMFRQAYYLNTKDCRKTVCGLQAAETLDHYELTTKPYEINKIGIWLTADYAGATLHSGAYRVDLTMTEVIKTKLFQFAYLTPESRVRLRQLAFGVPLKQRFTVPENRFNIDLTSKYKPYVKNTVYVSCPRNGNNCVWPNPLPKYSVRVGV